MKSYIELMNLLVDAGEITVKDAVTGNRIENLHKVWGLFNLSSPSLKSRGDRFTLSLSELASRTLNATRKELGWSLLGSEADRGEVQYRDYPIGPGVFEGNQSTIDDSKIGLFIISDDSERVRMKVGSLNEGEEGEIAQIRKILRLNPGDDVVVAAKALRIMADALIKITEGK